MCEPSCVITFVPSLPVLFGCMFGTSVPEKAFPLAFFLSFVIVKLSIGYEVWLKTVSVSLDCSRLCVCILIE